jgi:hypothetical protein
MPFETQLSELLHSISTDDLDVTALVDGGTRRGRSSLRRRRIGTSLSAAAVVAAVAVGGTATAQLLSGPPAEPPFASGSSSSAPKDAPTSVEPGPVTARLAVAGADVPATIGEIVGDQTSAGEILKRDPFPFVDDAQQTIVHFFWQGTLTTFIVESAPATCAQWAPQAKGTCTTTPAGGELLTMPDTTADQVTAREASYWPGNGYVVSVLSYNAVEGKDVAPIMAEPPLSMDQLIAVATSDTWFIS